MSLTKESDIVLRFTAAQTKIQKKLDGSLSVHGISFTEFQVMKSLFNATEQTLRRISLAEEIGLTASGITRLLAPLEKIGIVEKQTNARDARVSLVKLTDAGSRLYQDALNTVNRASDTLLEATNDEQKASLLALLKVIS